MLSLKGNIKYSFEGAATWMYSLLEPITYEIGGFLGSLSLYDAP